MLEFLSGFTQRNVSQASAIENSSVSQNDVHITFKVFNFSLWNYLLYFKKTRLTIDY